MNSGETLILGIGNTLLTDEGAGIHALNHLQSVVADIWSAESSDMPNLNFIDGGTLSFTLAVWIENCDNLIIFDAAQLHRPAGTIKTFIGSEMDEFLGETKRSAHEVGLIDLMDIARLTGHHPENRALIGIQPDEMGWGMRPTAAVEIALNKAVSEAINLITLWQKDDINQKVSVGNGYPDKKHEVLS